MTCWAPASRARRSGRRSRSATRCRAAPGAETDVLERRALDLVGVAPDRRAVLGAGSRTCGRSPRATRTRCMASAYWATRRRVFFSPPPPTMIGTRGRDSDCGRVEQALRLEVPALEARPRCRARPSTSRARSGASPRASRTARRAAGTGSPSARDSSSFQAAPMPSQARPPDRTSSVVVALTQRPGLPVVDAADHQPEAGRAASARP